MNCAEFKERAFDRDAASDAHAMQCASCAELRRALDAEGRLLAGAAAPRAPQDLWSRIQERIAEPRRMRPRGWIAAAAAFILTALGVFLVLGVVDRPKAKAPVAKEKRQPTIKLVVVEAPPEASRAFPGLVPSYDDVNPNEVAMSALTGGRK